MGETENTGVLYLNGKPLCLSELPEITFDSMNVKNNTRSFSQCQSYTTTLKPFYSKISRKRFVRSLINRGYSKKNAKWLAWYCCSKRISYGKAYSLIILGLSVR